MCPRRIRRQDRPTTRIDRCIVFARFGTSRRRWVPRGRNVRDRCSGPHRHPPAPAPVSRGQVIAGDGAHAPRIVKLQIVTRAVRPDASFMMLSDASIPCT